MTQRNQGEGSVFVQLSPDSPYVAYCVGVGEITVPRGDVEVKYGPAPEFGRWRPIATLSGVPGAVTTTLSFYFESARQGALRWNCPANLRINYSCTGQRSDPYNYLSSIVLVDARVTSMTLGASVSLEPSTDLVQVSMDISAARAIFWGPPEYTLLDSTSVVDALAEPAECGGPCAPGVGHLQRLHAVTTTAYLRSDNGGVSWDEVSLTGIAPSRIAKVGGRILVGGAGGEGEPGVVAYSDDYTTFTNVEVGGDDESVIGFAMTQDGTMWLATQSAIYSSIDRGASWTRAYSLASGTFTDIVASDKIYATSSAGLVVGPPFSLVAAPNLLTVDVNWGRRAVAVGSGGAVYRYYDGEITYVTSLGSAVSHLRFADGIFGIAIGATRSYITEDGGVTWRLLQNVTGTRLSVTDGPAWVVSSTSGVGVVEPAERS